MNQNRYNYYAKRLSVLLAPSRISIVFARLRGPSKFLIASYDSQRLNKLLDTRTHVL